ncbi:Wd Repeat-Containing Protein 87 [Manis pentadactyla]|nr:Wd Repeat-Containing Protein 87 [Manis pentadactyla]
MGIGRGSGLRLSFGPQELHPPNCTQVTNSETEAGKKHHDWASRKQPSQDLNLGLEPSQVQIQEGTAAISLEPGSGLEPENLKEALAAWMEFMNRPKSHLPMQAELRTVSAGPSPESSRD